MQCFFIVLQCLLFWVKRLSGTRPESLWEFNFKFVKQVKWATFLFVCFPKYLNIVRITFELISLQQGHYKNGYAKVLCLPQQYEDVHKNPDSDCYMLQVTTLNFIFIPVVMGMTLTLVCLPAHLLWIRFYILSVLLRCINFFFYALFLYSSQSM